MTKPHPAVLATVALLLFLLAGCRSDRGPVVGLGRSDIDSLNVLTFPVAVNLDDDPGSDGFAIKIYAGNHRTARTRPITSGALEILMFDGIPRRAEATPRKTWSFSADQLKAYQIDATIGTGYQLALRWDDQRPTRSRFSIVTRLLLDGTPVIVSSPVDIEMAR